MKKYRVFENYFAAKTRDRIGGTIHTSVFKKENGIFHSYSSYWQDENEKIVGFAESSDEEQAVKQSRKNLRKEWKELQVENL